MWSVIAYGIMANYQVDEFENETEAIDYILEHLNNDFDAIVIETANVGTFRIPTVLVPKNIFIEVKSLR